MSSISWRFVEQYQAQSDANLSRLDILMGARFLEFELLKRHRRSRLLAMIRALILRGLPVRIPKRFWR